MTDYDLYLMCNESHMTFLAAGTAIDNTIQWHRGTVEGNLERQDYTCPYCDSGLPNLSRIVAIPYKVTVDGDTANEAD